MTAARSLRDEPMSEQDMWLVRLGTVSQRVTTLMESRRMSFADLARATGLSKTGLYKIVDGQSDPRLSSLYRIADYFGVTVADLLDSPPPPSETKP